MVWIFKQYVGKKILYEHKHTKKKIYVDEAVALLAIELEYGGLK